MYDKKLLESIVGPQKIAAHKTLAESLAKNPKWMESRYFQKYRSEAILGGNITDDVPAVMATQELLNQILMGMETYIPLDFARQYTTNKAILNIPVGTYGAIAGAIAASVFVDSPKTETEVVISLDEEYGVQISWTRAHLEDATWDVMAEQNEGAGRGIKACLCDLLVTELIANATHLGAVVDLTNWTEIVAFLGATDIAGYGQSDYCLVSPTDYWALLGLDQFVNALYAGTDEVMRSGVAKTMTGCTFVKCEGITEPIAVNSKKAIALVTRRSLTVEPYEHPELNQYGFIASIRAKVGQLNNDAACIAAV
jgi:hypothetical protein